MFVGDTILESPNVIPKAVQISVPFEYTDRFKQAVYNNDTILNTAELTQNVINQQKLLHEMNGDLREISPLVTAGGSLITYIVFGIIAALIIGMIVAGAVYFFYHKESLGFLAAVKSIATGGKVANTRGPARADVNKLLEGFQLQMSEKPLELERTQTAAATTTRGLDQRPDALKIVDVAPDVRYYPSLGI